MPQIKFFLPSVLFWAVKKNLKINILQKLVFSVTVESAVIKDLGRVAVHLCLGMWEGSLKMLREHQ